MREFLDAVVVATVATAATAASIVATVATVGAGLGENIIRVLIWSFDRYIDSLFMVNSGETTGFPQQQYQMLALSWMLE